MRRLAMHIREHVDGLLEVSLPFQRRACVRHIQRSARALLAMMQRIGDESQGRAQPGEPSDPHASPRHRGPPSSEVEGPVWRAFSEPSYEGGAPEAEACSVQASPLRILLVEDNPFTQKLMTRLLTLRGHRVTVANQGKEALACLTDDHLASCVKSEKMFDVILMDIRMPVMDGLQTAEAIRRWEADLWRVRGHKTRGAGVRMPILAVSALISREDQARALQAGMDAFHGKPIQTDQLFSTIEQLTASSGRVVSAAGHSETDEPSDSKEETIDITIKLDLSTLLKTVENDRGLLREVIELYHSDAPEQLHLIRQGIEENNAMLVQDAAHALKGSSGAFGRTVAYDLASQLEQIGRSQKLDRASDVLTSLQRAVSALRDALDAKTRPSDDPQ